METGEYLTLENSDAVLPEECYYAFISPEPEYIFLFKNKELQLFDGDNNILVRKTKDNIVFDNNITLVEHATVNVQLCEKGWDLLRQILRVERVGIMCDSEDEYETDEDNRFIWMEKKEVDRFYKIKIMDYGLK